MKVDINANIHNKFIIEVRDVRTGEIEQRGYAENAVLNQVFTSDRFGNPSYNLGNYIAFGSGTTPVSPNDTQLDVLIGAKATAIQKRVFNQVPDLSYVIRKITILSTEYEGNTFSEVGLGSSSTWLATRALLKDSTGAQLIIGPKKSYQEIIIYSIVYAQVSLPIGFTLVFLTSASVQYNSIVQACCLNAQSCLINSDHYSDEYAGYYINGVMYNKRKNNFVKISTGVYRRYDELQTNQANGKIKTMRLSAMNPSYTNKASIMFNINLVVMAQNNSTIWPGQQFDKIHIGVGTGNKDVFELPWDEARLDKQKKVYVDGIEDTNVTWAEDSIAFTNPPGEDAVVEADYWVDYIPKDENHVLELEFVLTFGPGVPPNGA